MRLSCGEVLQQESPVIAPADGATAYNAERAAFWDANAARAQASRRGWGRYYHRRLAQIYSFLIPPNQRVLELGCGEGELLAAMKPSRGVGVDFSAARLTEARRRHPHLHFVQADLHALPLDEKFDFIILSDMLGDLWDIQLVLERLHPLCTPHTRIVMNFYSRLWEQPLAVAQKLGLKNKPLRQSWLTVPDVANLMYLTGFEMIRHWEEIILPLNVPLVAPFFNKVVVRLWPFNHLALTNFVIARPQPKPTTSPPLVSVIVPARNEAGNIPAILARTPEMGAGTEIVFVEGHSTDDTYAAIERAIAENPRRRCKLLRQTGKGKGDAVRLGFTEASGDVLMILDADLTVPPEYLPRFYEALISGKGDFINGVRLVYPMEDRAMRPINFIGNKFFSLTFSWLLGQPVKDTLCGTKVLRREAYDRIAANRAYFGDFDPFGDFDLLFGAARLNLKIVDVPIRYRERTYGATNIDRWRHGALLLKMAWFAARRMKMI